MLHNVERKKSQVLNLGDKGSRSSNDPGCNNSHDPESDGGWDSDSRRQRDADTSRIKTLEHNRGDDYSMAPEFRDWVETPL